MTEHMFAERLEEGLALIRSAMAEAPPASLSDRAAVEAVSLFCAIERAGAAGKALYAARVDETRAWAPSGARDAVDWLSSVAGESKSQTKGLLGAVRQLDAVPEVKGAFVEGRLSTAQMKALAPIGEADPGAAGELLLLAEGGATLSAVEGAVARVCQVAAGEAGARERDHYAHANRFLRVRREPRGGIFGEFLVPDADWARCAARIEERSWSFFNQAKRAGHFEAREQYLADAFVDLVAGARREPGDSSRTQVLVRVDAGALRRGSVEDGEVCEVPGVGTVSVATARHLMGDALFNVVVASGIDICTVSGTGRTIPRAVRVALNERDPACVVPGCDATLGLEIDHWREDFALGGPTRIDNLARVCKVHHDMHTYRGWHLEGGPGRWEWLPKGCRPSGDRPSRPRGAGPPGADAAGPFGTDGAGPRSDLPRVLART